MLRTPLVVLFLFGALVAFSQQIENVKATVSGDHVIITYHITNASPGTHFRVQLYASHNNFSAPLTQVSGDVGDVDIADGGERRIDWNAKDELQTYSGDISFEVRAAPVIVPLVLKSPVAGTVIKKGKTANIAWSGGSQSQSVVIELLHNGDLVQQVGQTPNSGNYSWDVPGALEKGGGYQFRITAGTEQATSSSFTIKKKTSALVYIAPVAVAGGAAALLLGGGGGGGGDNNNPPPTSNDLPSPPSPN